MGGSDAHVAQAVGGVHTVFLGETAADLRAALLAAATRPALDRGRHLAALPAHTAWLAWLLLARRRRAESPMRGRGTPRPYDQTAL